jgi:nucleolin
LVLEELFGGCGSIKSVRIGTGEDRRPRGFAHVEFSSNAEALEAMKLSGHEIDGRAIRLDLAQTK